MIKDAWARVRLGTLIKEESTRNRQLSCTDVYSVTNSQGFVASTEYFDTTVFSKDLTTYKVVRREMFAYNPSRINVGSVAVLEKQDRVIVSPLYVIFSTTDRLTPHYLLRFLKSDVGLALIHSKTSGSVRNSLRFKDLASISIPLPSVEEQLAITSELDAVQSMIDGYRQQLADLDALAQSLFLEMFGDPIDNPRGWKTDAFGDLFSLKSGENLSAKNFQDGRYPVYGGNGVSGYHNSFNRDGTYIIIGRVGALCGNVRLVQGQFWLTDNAFELKFKNATFDLTFLSRLLGLLNLRRKAKEMAQPVISNNSLRNIIVPCPPLDLQHTLSCRVAAIERQKQLYRQQLDDAETLMAERMQYYFS